MSVPPLVLATAAYTVLTIVVSHPVAWHLTDAIAGNPGDTYAHLWTLWWGKRALFDLGTWLNDASVLYFPRGVEHPILGLTPWIQLVAAPFVWLFGPIATYNLGFLLSTVLTGVTTYALAYELTRSPAASFLGGLVFAFAPTRFIHGLGHYAQIMTYLFPLYLLFLVRLLKHPSVKSGLATGVILAAAVAVNFVHVAYIVIPATAVLVGWHVMAEWRQIRWRDLLVALVLSVGVASVLIAPFVIPFLRHHSGDHLGYLASPGTADLGADLLGFVTPSPANPVFQHLGRDLHRHVARITGVGPSRRNVTEGLIYLGIVPIILAIWGTVKGKWLAGPWAILSVVTAVLSLGPLLKFNGDFVTYTVDNVTSHIVLPYAVLTELPLYSLLRTPSRLNATTMLALAVLVSFGAQDLLARLQRRRVSSAFMLVVLTPVILIEYLAVWPFPMTRQDVPAFYERVATEPGQFAILDYPTILLGYQQAHSFDLPMLYQTVHERPIIGGSIWRIPSEVRGTMRALDGLIALQPPADIVPPVAAQDRAAVLDALGFRYVVIHKKDTQFRKRPMPPERLAQLQQHVGSLLGPHVYDDEYITAFQVSTQQRRPAPLLALGANWGDLETDSATPRRWSLGQDSTVEVYGSASEPVRLVFTASSPHGRRKVNVLIDGISVGSVIVDDTRTFTTAPFELAEHRTVIALRINKPCQADPSVAHPPCRNVRVSNVALVPVLPPPPSRPGGASVDES